MIYAWKKTSAVIRTEIRGTYQLGKDALVESSLGLTAGIVFLVVLLQALVVSLPFLFAVLPQLGNPNLI